MKTLFVCAFSPSKNATQAGHRLAYEYITEISLTSEVDVVLLLRKGEDVSADLSGLTNVTVKGIYYFKTHRIIYNFITKHSISSFYTRYSPTVERSLVALIRENRYKKVRLEFSQVFYYATAIRAAFKDDIIIELGLHDIQLQLSLRKNSIIQSLFIHSIFKLESSLLQVADAILVLSAKDGQFIRSVYGENLVMQVLNIPMAGFVKNIKRNASTIERGSLLFWGAMNRKENEDSIIYFIEKVFKPICEELNLKLFVVGANPTKKLIDYNSSRIVVTGFVTDPTEYFEKAELGIIPLLYGAGL
jgi:hypothetical protein